jgi:hypothetical protein
MLSLLCRKIEALLAVVIIIIKLPNQAIASTPSAPRPTGAAKRGSTAPLCLQLLRTSQACTRYAEMLLGSCIGMAIQLVFLLAECGSEYEQPSPVRPRWTAGILCWLQRLSSTLHCFLR